MVQKSSTSNSENQIATLNNLNKSYKDKDILKEINLSIPKNKITALIGPNGAGKTSLIRIILNLIKPSSGEVILNTKSISAVLENEFLFANKTGLENINSFKNYFNYKTDNLDFLVNALGLTNHLNKKVQYYSKGMKRKLSILITLLRDSEFTIFDEPTSGLDPESRVQLRNLFLKLKESGKTLFISTHDLDEIQKVCNNIVIINKGHIIETIENSNELNLEKEFFKSLEVRND